MSSPMNLLNLKSPRFNNYETFKTARNSSHIQVKEGLLDAVEKNELSDAISAGRKARDLSRNNFISVDKQLNINSVQLPSIGK